MAGNQPFSIQDAAAYPYAAGVPGALVDLVGIKGIEVSPNTETVENRGDGAVMASSTDLTYVDITVTMGTMTPVSLAAISGGTVSTTGTGSTAINKLSRKSSDVIPYFKLAGQTRAKDADAGATRVTFNKCAWNGGPDFSLSDNEFAEFSVNCRALPDSLLEFYLLEAYATWTALA